jgi:hypothetical protein
LVKAAPKLKVFQAQSGFYDTVVAARSQAAALRVWGVHQDLFKGGGAGPATDPRAIEAALAHPNIPLRRALGTDDDFALVPKGLPKVPAAPKAAVASAKKAEPAKPSANRSKLDQAQAALRALDEARKAQEASLRAEQAELAQKISEAQANYVEARGSATAVVVQARQAYRKAGGRD